MSNVSLRARTIGLEMLTLARELNLAAARSLSLAMETNGRGFHGFIVELPGAYVRGLIEEEAVSKAPEEARSYLAWLGQESSQVSKARIVQTHRCKLMIEDADCEILLADDKSPMNMQEFQHLVELAKYSGLTFTKLYDSSELKDWVDEARIRKTFYGQTKKTVREIFEHVKQTQVYYVSRTGSSVTEAEEESFVRIRELSLNRITNLFRQDGNSKIYATDNEDWTLKKVLRRFIWHDRIHGKAITRILEKQRRLGLIDSYENPFLFKISSQVN